MLDLQKLDTRLAQLAHKKRSLPVLAQIETATMSPMPIRGSAEGR